MNLTDVILAHPNIFLVPLMPDSYEQGDELIGQNPRRDDKEPGTFNINLVSGKWADFACQDEASGADPISFISYCKGISPKKVRQEVQAIIKEKGLIAGVREQVEDENATCVIPVPETVRLLGNPDTHSIPTGEWKYLTPDAELICLVRRYENGNGKEHRTWTYHSDDAWKQKRPPKPWPLYNQQDFIDDDLIVYVAEGEKAADSASQLLDGIGTCTLGGSGSVKDAELSLLHNRHIVILPDADDAGRKYAQKLIARLQGKVKSLKIVDVWELGWSDGEDIADFNELPADWDEAIISSEEWSDGNKSTETTSKSQASGLVEIAEDLDFFNADDIAYVDLTINGHRETWPLRSKSFKSYLARQYQLAHGKAPNAQAIADAMCTLTGKALFECDTVPVHTRVAGHGDTVYIDMCNADWQAIKITADGWSIVDDYPVRFIRRKGVRALPVPDKKGDARLLFNYINLHSQDEERLVLAWLMQSLRPVGPYPSLIFQGEQGTAKTTACRVMVRLIDPKVAETRTRPRNEHDLLIAANNGWVVSLDNLSGVPIWLSDALCRLATGGGFSARELFTDMDEVLIDVKRPTVLNGIDDVAVRPDLIDRSIILTLAPIAKEDRKPESSFWRHFDQASGKILGGLLDGLSTAIREYPTVDLPDLPRMADFAEWATAAESSFGYQTGEFLKSFDKKRENAIQAGLDGSHLAIAIEDLMADREEWEGTMKALLADLTPLVDERTANSKEWPKTPHKLGGELRRIATSFRALGVDIQIADKPQRDGVHVLITDNRTPPDTPPDNKDTKLSSHSSQSSQSPAERELGEQSEIQNVTLLSDVSAQTDACELGEQVEVQNAALLSEVRHPVTGDPVPVDIVTDPLEAATKLEVMAIGLPLGADLETRPKPEYKDQRGAALSPNTGLARLLQVSDGESVLVIDLDKVPLADLPLSNPLIFHNAAFDSAFLLDSGIDCPLQCTQLAVTALTNKQRPSLAWAGEEILGIPVDKTEQVSDWSGQLTPEQYQYAALDAVLVHALHVEVQQRLEDKKLSRGNDMVQRCVRPIARARHRGILLDIDKHQALVDSWTKDRDEAKERFIAIADVDPESPKQMAEWLSNNLDPDDLTVWPKTGKGQLSTDRDTLRRFAHVPMVRPLLQYRHAGHRVKTWGENYRRHIDNDGRIRPGFQLLGACTGRMSSNKPNVQQLPRDPAFRECLIAADGHKLVAADYGQIELRTAGLLTGDNNILDAYRKGQDLHTKIVSIVTGKPLEEVSSSERSLGKALNFGLLYGAGVKTFRAYASANYGLDVSLEEAEQYKSQFDKAYAKLRFWQLEQYRRHQQAGVFRTVGGRRCVFKDKRRCYTDSRNYPIQGAAADLQMRAIHAVSEKLTGEGVYLVNMVHDELILEVEEGRTEHVKDQLIFIMTDVFTDLFRRLPGVNDVVMGLVEVKSGNSYAEAK